MTLQTTQVHDNQDSDMTFKATRIHDNENPDSNDAAAALILEQALDGFISALTGNRPVPPAAMLFGIDAGESVRLTLLVGDAECAYELLEEPTNRQAANKYAMIALVVHGWVEINRNDDEETSSGDTGPARVRMTFLSGKHHTLTIMRFADKEVLFPDGVGHGPLNDALTAFWANQSN